MKIRNFGSCNIDYVYSLDHIVVPGETLTASKMEQFPGGKGLNQSVAAARASSSEMSGRPFAVSHFEIALQLTPICSASRVCVIPFASRSLFITEAVI